MVRIAVAGGTGGLGRTLVGELCQGDEHSVFVLSRKAYVSVDIGAVTIDRQWAKLVA